MDDILPEIDLEYLQSKEFNFEIIPFDGKNHLIIKGFRIPEEHYSVGITDMLIQIPAGYPSANLDMFWTNPHVLLKTGQNPHKADNRHVYHEREWQMWSRHVKWRPGIDNLRTFIKSIQVELSKGI